MKLIANSMSSIHSIPSRVNVKAVGSHSGSGTRESSAGIRSCGSSFCLRSRAGHVTKKWGGILDTLRTESAGGGANFKLTYSLPEAGSIRLEPMAAKNETYSKVVPCCEV